MIIFIVILFIFIFWHATKHAESYLSDQGSNPGSQMLVAQSCLTLCNTLDCSLPGSSDHEILQAGITERVVISLSRGSSWPRDWTRVTCISGRFFIVWVTSEALGSHNVLFWFTFIRLLMLFHDYHLLVFPMIYYFMCILLSVSVTKQPLDCYSRFKLPFYLYCMD